LWSIPRAMPPFAGDSYYGCASFPSWRSRVRSPSSALQHATPLRATLVSTFQPSACTCQHACFAGSSAFCRSGLARLCAEYRYPQRPGSALSATLRDDFAESEPEGRSVLKSEGASPSVLTRRRSRRADTLSPPDLPHEPLGRVVVLVDDALFEGDDRVVRDVDVDRADLGATLGDVAEADAVVILEVG
jgi:hypothetical protein